MKSSLDKKENIRNKKICKVKSVKKLNTPRKRKTTLHTNLMYSLEKKKREIKNSYYKNNLFFSKILQIKDKKIYSEVSDHFDYLIDSFRNLDKINLKEIPNNNSSTKIQNKKKILVFDLDQTLISSNIAENHQNQKTQKVKIILKNKLPKILNIKLRPYAKKILKELSKFFEIIIFTASEKFYADPIIDLLDPQNNIIKKRFYRQNCLIIKNKFFIKDLKILRYDLKDVIIIDDSVSFFLQLENGVTILPFFDNEEDSELLYLQRFLMKMVCVEDVRAVIMEHFKWDKFEKFWKKPRELLEEIYFNS